MKLPKFIDIHSHLQFVAFDTDREEVLKRSLDSETWMINVGTQFDTSKNAVDLAHTVADGIYATVGLHPIHTSKSHHDTKELGEGGQSFVSRGEEFDFDKYKGLALDSKVVGIGECGLD
ncbi:MAG: TatD family hydrolase, partial [Candidatus Vogelbacteria bacterium]|nr:TatD family hydrolase [Candidatus Vogelbacteria bacterium]